MAPGAPRERLDRLLVLRGLADTREKARALILAGRVSSTGRRLEKAGALVPVDAPLEVEGPSPWVGRGALKLLGALERFGVDVAGRDALDVGASTGGFTQVLLDRGARAVVALDVGRGQLDWRLRTDARVVVLEGVNARYLEPGDLPFRPSIAVVDVSFISLRQVLPAIVACLAPHAEVVALVKPQFEVGRGKVGAGGVVRDPALHREVLRDVAVSARDAGWGLDAIAASPIRGAEGNAEFFALLRPGRRGLEGPALEAALDAAVGEAHGRTA